MSVGQEFDPSLLEGKDRGELAALAEALGEKPPARAKKSDIVALILRLVGADGSSAPAASEPDAAEGNDDRPESGDDADGADGPAAPEAAEGGGDAEADGSSADDAADGGAADAAPADRDGGGSNQGGQGQDGGEESGNRRRRRRGRDRDRRGEGEEVPSEPVDVEGVVDLREEGYGFLRVAGYLPSRNDAYVSVKQARQFGLRRGDVLKGRSRAANRNEKNPALLQVDAVNGHPAHTQPERPRLEDLTSVFPSEPLALESADAPDDLIARIVDLLAPIGKGQRGLLAAPPRSGRSTVVKQLVRALERNHPDLHVIVLLIAERPEEVTDLTRWMVRGEVAASTFDRPADDHVALADLVVDRAERLVEQGRDVVLVVDGLSRLTRAHELAAAGSGRTVDQGLEASAITAALRLLGAAGKVEEAGSLTVLATVAVDSGSRVDELILDAVEGAANLELRLDRRLADRRIFPAVDVDATATRHEELLYGADRLAQVHELRRRLADLRDESGGPAAGLAFVLERLRATATNAELLDGIGR